MPLKHRRFLTDISACSDSKSPQGLFDLFYPSKTRRMNAQFNFCVFPTIQKSSARPAAALKGSDRARHDDFRTRLSMSSCPLDRPPPPTVETARGASLCQMKIHYPR